MKYSKKTKEKARKLRKNGRSLSEIAATLNISKSTASVWLRDVKISKRGKKRLQKKQAEARAKGIKVRRDKKRKYKEKINNQAKEILQDVPLSLENIQFICAILFWAEGGKSDENQVELINSDPRLIQTFLTLLRTGFNINEERLHALVHIHDYHNDPKIKKFWSEITCIPISQFYKSYHKENTGNRKRENYKGSISIRYHDPRVALTLKALYTNFAYSLNGGVVSAA